MTQVRRFLLTSSGTNSSRILLFPEITRPKLYYSQSFRRDIAKLTGYITKVRDGQTATAFASRLKARCEALLLSPGMGAPYDWKSDVRKINEGPYKIFYRVTETEIIILRLWDGRRGSEPSLPR